MKKTLPQIFYNTAERFPSKTAFQYKEEGIYYSLSYQEAKDIIEGFAKGLQSLGVKKGDKIALLSENRPEWAFTDLGSMRAGAVLVPFHTTLNPKAIRNLLNHSEAKILVVSNSELLNKVLIFQKEIETLEKIIFLEELDSESKNISKKDIIEWEDLLKESEKRELQKVESDPEEICTIIYTSGTMGEPKGVMLSHNNFISDAEAVTEVISISEKDTFLSFLPLSHVLERLAGYYTAIMYGSTIAYAESIKTLAENLKEIKPTILISVPRVFEKFYDKVWDKIEDSSKMKREMFLWALKQNGKSIKNKIADQLVFSKIRKQLGGRLRFAVSGGASLNKRIAKFFQKEVGIDILEGYGLTETSPVVSVNRMENIKLGTVGQTLSGVEAKISPEKEILVRGPNVMKGYYKNKELTDKAIDKEGWFHTDDLGFIDQEGFLTVIGRKKELIVTSGGKNVWPEEVEKELNHDSFISQSMVLGHKRNFISALIIPDWQEVKEYLLEHNFPVKDPDVMVEDENVVSLFEERIKKVNEHLSHPEKVKKFKLLDEEFSQKKEELTPTFKLRRHIIERHYTREINEMYS